MSVLKRTVSRAQQCDSIGVKLEKFVNFFKLAEFVQKELFFSMSEMEYVLFSFKMHPRTTDRAILVI